MRLQKIIAGILTASIICSGMVAFAAAQVIEINGAPTQIPAEMGSMKEQDDRTFVPVRFIMENLHCTVEYIEETKTAIITDTSSTYLIQEGNPILYVLPDQYTETVNIEMDTAAFIETVEVDGQEYGRMYVPIRFLADAIGYDVDWNEETQTVTLDARDIN